MSYEELKKELEEDLTPVDVTTVCEVKFIFQAISGANYFPLLIEQE